MLWTTRISVLPGLIVCAGATFWIAGCGVLESVGELVGIEFEDQDEPGDVDEDDTDGPADDDSNGPTPPDGDASVPDTVPDFEAARFTNPTQIDNSFFPLVPGTTWTYTGQTADGTERIVVEVLDETREVAGVATRVVRDQVFLDDVLIEDTQDWYAQDDDGNVWYMGEEVDNYNYDDQGNLIDITHEGVWEAGLDVANAGTIARPGHQMKLAPAPGDVYHQEFYQGEAEDIGTVVAVDVPVTLADGTTYSTLQIRDSNPLDPESVDEFKYYARDVGLILEEPVDGGGRVELVSVEP